MEFDILDDFQTSNNLTNELNYMLICEDNDTWFLTKLKLKILMFLQTYTWIKLL